MKAETLPEEEFDASLEEKGELIDELNRLDEGFETLYENIREQLMAGKEQYRAQIAVLQQLIRELTDQSVSIQTQEARNKTLAEKFFSGRRKEIQQGRANSKAAINYYRNMSNSHVVSPQFMDQKN